MNNHLNCKSNTVSKLTFQTVSQTNTHICIYICIRTREESCTYDIISFAGVFLQTGNEVSVGACGHLGVVVLEEVVAVPLQRRRVHYAI